MAPPTSQQVCRPSWLLRSQAGPSTHAAPPRWCGRRTPSTQLSQGRHGQALAPQAGGLWGELFQRRAVMHTAARRCSLVTNQVRLPDGCRPVTLGSSRALAARKQAAGTCLHADHSQLVLGAGASPFSACALAAPALLAAVAADGDALLSMRWGVAKRGQWAVLPGCAGAGPLGQRAQGWSGLPLHCKLGNPAKPTPRACLLPLLLDAMRDAVRYGWRELQQLRTQRGAGAGSGRGKLRWDDAGSWLLRRCDGIVTQRSTQAAQKARRALTRTGTTRAARGPRPAP
jgi:hypothetical protein